MQCNKCSTYIYNTGDKFCYNCGAKLEQDNYDNLSNNQVNYNNTKIIKDDSLTFLIIGIVLSMCCFLPFGVAVILIDELKYKKLINDGMVEEAKKIRALMIFLIIIGIVFFLGFQLFNIIVTIIDMGTFNNNYV